MDKRREFRREKKEFIKKARKTITILFFIIVFLLWNIYYLLQSDLFNLKEIEIHNNIGLTDEEIIEASRLIMHRNILQYNLTQTKEYILDHPYIKAAEVNRKLPKYIIITVSEREKYAIIPYMGSFIYIDQDKVVLEVVTGYLEEDLPLITAVEFNSFKIGEEVDIVNQHLLDNVIELIKVSKEIQIVDMISEINIGDANNIRLMTFDGIEVLLGQTEDLVYAMMTLKEILINLYTRNMTDVIVDMRYEGQISVSTRNQREEN